MSAEVWPYHRAECARPGCGYVGDLHLSPTAARDDAKAHDVGHELIDRAAADRFAQELDDYLP